MAEISAQHVIDELAERLRRSVVVDDPAVKLLYASRHFGDEDAVRTHAVLQRQASSAAVGHVLAQGVAGWTTPGVVPPYEEIGMLARVCCPVRWRGELLGLLLVVDADGSVTTSELSAIAAASERLAPILAGEREEGDQAERQRAAAVHDLLSDVEAVRRAALRSLGSEVGAEVDTERFQHVRVVTLRVADLGSASAPHVRTALGIGLREAAAVADVAALTTVGDGEGSVVLGSARRPVDEDRAVDLARRLVGRVAEVAAGRFGCVGGVGGGVDGPDRAWASYDQSVLACAAATEQGVPVRSWSTLGPDAVLLRLPPGGLTAEALPAEVQRLLDADRDGRLLETLRAFLDHAGAVPATAEALHIHRTTLYYRLEKIARLAEVDLDDGDTRLALHLGVRLLDRPGFLRR